LNHSFIDNFQKNKKLFQTTVMPKKQTSLV